MGTVTTVVEPEDAPSSQADFDALTKTQLSDVAVAGRRIERAHRLRPRQRRHLRSVPTGPSVRPTRGSRVPLVVKYVIALAIVAAVVVASLLFPTRHDPPHSAPVPRPDVVIATDRLFPAHLTAANQVVYQRVTASTSDTCAQGPGIPWALADAVAQAGGCEAIQLALYTDAQRTMRITIGVITMEQVAEMQAVNDAILRSGGAMMVGMLRPPAGTKLPDLADGALRPAFVTPTGSAIVVGVGGWLATSPPNADALREGITQVMGTVTQTLIVSQPVATVSRPNR